MRDSIAAALYSASRTPGEDAATLQFRFSADDPVFAGHFPGRPILPGVFQIEMTRIAAEWPLERRLAVREVSKSKFLRPILPEDLVSLELKWSESGDEIQARAVFSVRGEPAGETVLRLCRSE